MQSTIRLFLAFLSLSTVVAAQAQRADPIVREITTCGTLITSSGRYELANDLLNCTGSGIRVRTTGIVIINLNSHQITGAAMNNAGISVTLYPREDSVVAIGGPGSIAGFAAGIQTSGVGDLELYGLTCTRNVTGFDIGGGANGDVARNTASENAHGFVINNSTSKFSLNTATRNGYEGFVISGAGNNFSQNTALDNVRYGIYTTGRQNQIVGNTARGNSLYDLFEATDCLNQWTNNTFTHANLPCIH